MHHPKRRINVGANLCVRPEQDTVRPGQDNIRPDQDNIRRGHDDVHPKHKFFHPKTTPIQGVINDWID